MKFLFCICIFLTLNPVWSQGLKGARLWQDGWYADLKAFQLNQPTEDLKKLMGTKFVFDNEENLVFLQADSGFLAQIWGLCLEGQPYLHLPKDSLRTEAYFVRLRLTGRICYFEFPSWELKPVEMGIYHPNTGRKIGSRTIHNREKITRQQLLDLETGQIQPFNLASLRLLVQNDLGVLRSLEDQPEASYSPERLLKVIRIYNERNPLP